MIILVNFIRKIIRPQTKEEEEFSNEIQKIIGSKPNRLRYYKKAFTHSSIKKVTSQGKPINYERLEFLGDAVLGSIIAHYLFKKLPTGTEGYLTQMRSKIVSREHLNEIGKDLRLIDLVKCSIPKKSFGENIHGNIFEALVGAIFLDKGYKHTVSFVYRVLIEPYIDIERLEGKITSYKSVIIEWSQKEKRKVDYEIYEDTGNDIIKHFSVKLFLDKEVIAKGRATSKKKAEEIASKRAYYKLQDTISTS